MCPPTATGGNPADLLDINPDKAAYLVVFETHHGAQLLTSRRIQIADTADPLADKDAMHSHRRERDPVFVAQHGRQTCGPVLGLPT